MKKRAQKRKKGIDMLGVTFFVFIAAVIGVLCVALYYQQTKASPGEPSTRVIKKTEEQLKSELTIYPTLYVTGSSGSPKNNISHLVQAVTNKNNAAKPGLTVIAETGNKYKLRITGKIDASNKYPAIAVGTDHGTNNHEIYQYAIKATIEYLAAHYNVPWYNILGYSSGAGGAMRFLINYSQDKNLPPAKKFVALDGEFNRKEKLRTNETMESLYQKGPENKSADYNYFEKNYSKMDKGIHVYLMALDTPVGSDFDGVLPWSDLFSVYNLFEKNGNITEKFTYTNSLGERYSHGSICKMPAAQDYIEKVFYHST